VGSHVGGLWCSTAVPCPACLALLDASMYLCTGKCYTVAATEHCSTQAIAHMPFNTPAPPHPIPTTSTSNHQHQHPSPSSPPPPAGVQDAHTSLRRDLQASLLATFSDLACRHAGGGRHAPEDLHALLPALAAACAGGEHHMVRLLSTKQSLASYNELQAAARADWDVVRVGGGGLPAAGAGDGWWQCTLQACSGPGVCEVVRVSCGGWLAAGSLRRLCTAAAAAAAGGEVMRMSGDYGHVASTQVHPRHELTPPHLTAAAQPVALPGPHAAASGAGMEGSSRRRGRRHPAAVCWPQPPPQRGRPGAVEAGAGRQAGGHGWFRWVLLVAALGGACWRARAGAWLHGCAALKLLMFCYAIAEEPSLSSAACRRFPMPCQQ
jgi:hypothetical protein